MLDWLRRKATRAPQALADSEPAWATVSGLPPGAARGQGEWAPTVPMPVSDGGAAGAHRAPELRRLAALQARGDAAYQYVAEAAARICGTSLAGISLLDGEVLRFKAVAGQRPAGLPADGRPCRMAMAGSEPVVLRDDPALDVRTPNGPLRFYAGVRLAGAHGLPVGVVWVADLRARELTPVQLRTLELLARQTGLLMASRAP